MEILQVAEAVARERGISKDEIIAAIEYAVQMAGKKKYGHDFNIKAEINKKDGGIMLYSVFDVVENVENSYTQISYEEALSKDPNINIGQQIIEPLQPIDLKRVVAQTVKQAIVQQVREVERKKQCLEFKDKIGEIINGLVVAVEFGNIIIDVGKGVRAILLKNQMIKGEMFKVNDRIRAYVQDVRSEVKGPQIFLSRTDNNMLVKLFTLEVPEIYNGTIEIKAIARDPGSKAKIAVFCADSSRDAVGACIGIKGTRIKSITNELNGERVDVVKWSNDVAQFVINAIQPAQVSKVIIDEEKHLVEIIVPADQLSSAIGRRGQNVRLASKLVNWSIDIMTEEQESNRRNEEFNAVSNLFIQKLHIDEVIAQLLVAEEFTTVEQIANTELSTLNNIEGFNEELSSELKDRALNYLNEKNNNILSKLESLGVEQELLEIIDIPLEWFIKLAENGIKNIEDLEELSLNEFRTLLPKVTDEEFDNIIGNIKFRR